MIYTILCSLLTIVTYTVLHFHAVLFGFWDSRRGIIIPLKLQAINPHIPAEHDAARHATRHITYNPCFCVHTNQGQKKNKKKQEGMEGNAVRVDLIWDDGERREKEGGGGRRLRGGGVGGKRIDGLKRTRVVEPC
ncbi:hypothetical protein F5888DRAFT_1110863 [Russula emetica]|nr:hypothetical protein F5888DRAFT_1110863 [Russula emetica]